MAPKLVQDDVEESSETTPLLTDTPKKKIGLASVDFSNITLTRRDKLLVTILICTTFGDAVEIYLPGIIDMEFEILTKRQKIVKLNFMLF